MRRKVSALAWVLFAWAGLLRSGHSLELDRLLPPFGGAPAAPEPPPGFEAGPLRFGSAPDRSLTPGVLCTERDRDFDEHRYPERIAHCRRRLSQDEKKAVARRYGVPWEEHSLYQFDHLLSLCLGGSNDLRNIWPMPYADARAKARLEAELCGRLSRGELTQRAAVAEELSWFDGKGAPLGV